MKRSKNDWDEAMAAVMSLQKTLTKKQFKQVFVIVEECRKQGASSHHMAPFYAMWLEKPKFLTKAEKAFAKTLEPKAIAWHKQQEIQEAARRHKRLTKIVDECDPIVGGERGK